MWDRPEHRLALLELVVLGSLRCRKAQQEAWRHLAEWPWTRRTSRRDELAVVESRRHELEQLLTQVWPEWQVVSNELTGAGLPISMTGWLQLQDIERARVAKGLPSRLNRRTATALVGPHSKASLSAPRREALAYLDVMHDDTLRLRTPEGLRLQCGGQELDCGTVTGVLGEVVLTERALADGTVLTGCLPQAILLVENLGAYLDTPAPPGWLLAHVPGWDTHTVRLLLQQLPDAPVAAFQGGRRLEDPASPDATHGDLDAVVSKGQTRLERLTQALFQPLRERPTGGHWRTSQQESAMRDQTQLFSTGEAATALGVTRDALHAALRAGAPEPRTRLAGRRVFAPEDLDRLRNWFAARGRAVTVVPTAAGCASPAGGRFLGGMTRTSAMSASSAARRRARSDRSPSACAWSRQAIFRIRYARFRVRAGSPQTSTYRPASSPADIRSSRASSSLMFMLRGFSLVLWRHNRRNQRAHRAVFCERGQGDSGRNLKIPGARTMRPSGPCGSSAGRRRPGWRRPPAAVGRAGLRAGGCLRASASSPTHTTNRDVCWVMYAVPVHAVRVESRGGAVV